MQQSDKTDMQAQRLRPPLDTKNPVDYEHNRIDQTLPDGLQQEPGRGPFHPFPAHTRPSQDHSAMANDKLLRSVLRIHELIAGSESVEFAEFSAGWWMNKMVGKPDMQTREAQPVGA